MGCKAAGLLRSGDFDEVSLIADYIINKHYDIYGGVNRSEVTDGLANGFPGTTVGTSVSVWPRPLRETGQHVRGSFILSARTAARDRNTT